jgi:hypothetical protein
MRTRITHADWPSCNDSYPMLWSCRRFVREHPRKGRLFAVACCRRIWHRMSDPRSRQAVEVAERYADGLATRAKLVQAEYAAQAAHRDAQFKGKVGASPEWAAQFSASGDAWFAATRASNFAYVATGDGLAHSGPERAAQADLLRCIFGPFACVWQDVERRAPGPMDDTITALARAVYDSHAFDRLPELADLLERHAWRDDVLSHLRSPTAHARGCWVIDLLLGKA